MISTKSNDPDNQRLGFEEAIAKGRLYNPLNGKELLEFIIRHIKGMLLAAEPPLAIDLADQITTYTHTQIERHPSLDSEVLAYPKAEVVIQINLGPYTTEDQWRLTRAFVNIVVIKFPQEEKRGFGVIVEMDSDITWGDRQPLLLTSKLKLDEIPPDALRILNDLPVPTPRRVAGTGPSGESTIVDEPKVASAQQKAAVEKQFGDKAPTRVPEIELPQQNSSGQFWKGKQSTKDKK